IVHDADRTQALERLRGALAACEIVGPKSNVAFLERLVSHPVVVDADIDTGYLDRHLDDFLDTDPEPDPGILAAAACALLMHDEAAARRAAPATDPHSPWAEADAWRIGHAGRRVLALVSHGERLEVDAHGSRGRYRLRHGEQETAVEGSRLHDGFLQARFDDVARRVPVRLTGGRVTVHDARGWRHHFERAPAYAWASDEGAGGDQVVAPMPG